MQSSPTEAEARASSNKALPFGVSENCDAAPPCDRTSGDRAAWRVTSFESHSLYLMKLDEVFEKMPRGLKL
eukprot:29555-Pleurochrysis_carterae.AAC.3